jgi:serine-type D-Ala-D-Ala carboxypeptidase (penicillin-binding protein 5/6)
MRHSRPTGRLAAAAAAVLALALTTAAGSPPPAAGHRRGPVGGPQLGGRGVVVNYPAGHARKLPRVAASAYVIADAGSGAVLAAKDPHGWYRPASTLKVLTAVTLMPVLKPGATVATSHRAAIAVPSKVGLIQGDSYRVADLFHALLMISANDAAVALAQATGSYAKGVAMMNAQARHLQAYDTVAMTPNGLDKKGQHASAYDEALFARAALAIPAFMRDEALRVTTFPRRPHHRPVKLWNQNTMLESYRGDLGGKIGWTTPARATFIGWARRGGHTLIVTILHCTPLTEMTYATRLLNWGFAMDGKVRPVGKLVRPLPSVTAEPRRTGHLRAVPRPARQGPPTVPLAAGIATLVLAAMTAAAIVLAGRRGHPGKRAAR